MTFQLYAKYLRGYGLPNGDKRFYLFNTSRWAGVEFGIPEMGVVPILWQGKMDDLDVEKILAELKASGSHVVPFMNPEGIVIYHTAGNFGLKKTFDKDGGKSQVEC